VHGLGFESLSSRAHQWWRSAWSWVRIFDFVGVNGGVVHVVDSNLSPLGSMQCWCSAWIFDFLGVNGGVVHGRGFESLTFGGQWWCSVHDPEFKL
jgi:hypothetical protein